MPYFRAPVLLFLSLYIPWLASAQSTTEPALNDPRLQTLEKELESGHRHALEEFWQEVAKRGAPLVEPIDGDSQNLLVTFLWRGDEKNRYIAVFPLAMLNPVRHLMAHLPETDLWYKTYRMRRDARFRYLVSASDSLAPFAAENPGEKGGWIAAAQADPLNPHRVVVPKDPESPESEEEIWSVVELPGAPRQPFVSPRPDVAKGQVRLIRYESPMLKNKRRIWIYTPPGYTPTAEPYGLLVLFDGWDYTQVIPTPTILDNMEASGVIRPLFAVMIDQIDRSNELDLNQTFADFVSNEVVPWIRQRYHVTARPERTIIGGLSLGGLAAAYTALRHPEVFGNVLSQSGSYQYGADDEKGLIRQFVLHEKVPVRFYLEAGLLEVNTVPSLLYSNRRLRDVLEAKGYSVRYSEYNGRHDYICWRGSLSEGLISLTRSERRPTTR